MPDPRQRGKAQPRKTPQPSHRPTREIRRESSNDARPPFSLHQLARDYGIGECDRDEKAAVVDLLHEMSQRNWQEPIFGSRRGTGFEKIARSSINVGIPTGVTEDVQIISIRIRQGSRLIGFREGAIFHAVWVDTRHRVYDG